MSSSCRNCLRIALKETDSGDHLRTVLNFYAFDLKEIKIRVDKVRHDIERELQDRVKIHSYGSVVTGLALKDSDIDLFLTPSSCPPILYDEVVKHLRRSKCFCGVKPIRKARVPIIQCRHSVTGISIDLNMSNPHGVYNSLFVAELLKCDQRLRDAFLFLKIWATELKLIGRSGLTSHCLVSMIIFSLQVCKLLPNVEHMQRFCPSIIFQGNNFAYKLPPPPIVPDGISTQWLITNFFNYYCTLDFEKFVVSPFLGRCLDRREQLGSQLGCKKICVQDPFERNQNLAKSLSQKNLYNFKQCLELTAQAYRNEDLKWQPKKLYDYLLFGIVEKLENRQNNQILIYKTENTCAPPIPMTFIIHMTQEDYNGLLPIREFFHKDYGIWCTRITWRTCRVATIRDVLTEVYGLKIESEEKKQNSVQMFFSGKLDTWSGRDFTPKTDESFLSYQLLQSRSFSMIRPGNPVYAVNVRGYLLVVWNDENNMIKITMVRLSGPQSNGSMLKLFYEFQHFLNKYSFKEQASIWSITRLLTTKCLIFQITIAGLIFVLFAVSLLFCIILFITAVLFWEFLERIFGKYFVKTLQLRKNELYPKNPIYR